MNRSLIVIVSATVLAAAAGVAIVATSRSLNPARTGSAALSDWTCEMCPTVHSDKPGSCPVCKMDLHQAKPGAAVDPHAGHTHAAKPGPAGGASTAVTDWTCEMHPKVHSDKPGSCPVCKMDLHQAKPGAAAADPHAGHTHPAKPGPAGGAPMAAADWTCEMHPKVHSDKPGSCPVCKMDLHQAKPGAAADPHAGHDPAVKAAPPAAGDLAFWTCPMHPSVRMPTPAMGCPICKMDLVAVTKQELASGIVRMDPARRQALGVRTSEVKKQAMTATLRASGVVAWDESRLVDVSPRSGGWIRTLMANTPGQLVTAGTTLFTLYSPDLIQAQAEWLAVAGSDDLRALARTKLMRLGFPESSFAVLEQTGKPLEEVPFTAPITGVLIDKAVVAGTRIDAGMRVLRLADATQVWIEAALPADDLALITTGAKAEIALANGGSLTASVAAVIPWIDDATRTGRVRLVAANPDGQLRPGTYATVTLTLPLGERLAVPEDSVVRGGEKQVVFVDLGDGRWQPVRLVPGVRAGGLVEVREGPAAGAKVANGGVFLIASESRLKSGMDKW